MCVDENDASFRIREDNPAGGGFGRDLKQLLRLLQVGCVHRNADESPGSPSSPGM